MCIQYIQYILTTLIYFQRASTSQMQVEWHMCKPRLKDKNHNLLLTVAQLLDPETEWQSLGGREDIDFKTSIDPKTCKAKFAKYIGSESKPNDWGTYSLEHTDCNN